MLMMIITPLIGVLGAILLSSGVWMIYHPAGYIAGGLLCLLWSWLAARFLSTQKKNIAGGN